MNRNVIMLLSGMCVIGCVKDVKPPASDQCGTDAARSACISPGKTPEYYIDQGIKYFRTMESSVPANIIPNYSDLVIRWEWHPWLLLTGYTRDGLIQSDIFLKLNPTAYDTLDCRFFNKQPFCRCHVIFNYSGEQCPIYEEFTFNNQGEITFIEAWSDFPSLIPMDKRDYWAEGENIKRLSTRVPGLGNTTGLIDLNAAWMADATESDPDLADMVRRAKDPINTYIEELLTHQQEVAEGCNVPVGDEYPYYP